MSIVRLFFCLISTFAFFYGKIDAKMSYIPGESAYNGEIYEKARNFIGATGHNAKSEQDRRNYIGSHNNGSFYNAHNDSYDDSTYNGEIYEKARNFIGATGHNAKSEQDRRNYIGSHNNDSFYNAHNDSYDDDSFFDAYDDSYDDGVYYDAHDDQYDDDVYYDAHDDQYDDDVYYDAYDDSYDDDVYYDAYDGRNSIGGYNNNSSKEYDSEDVNEGNTIAKRVINFGINLFGFLKDNNEESVESSEISVSSKKPLKRKVTSNALQIDDVDEEDNQKTTSSKQSTVSITTEQEQNAQTLSSTKDQTSTTKNQSTISENIDQKASIQKALNENKSSIQNTQNKILEQEEIIRQLIQVISAIQQKLDQTTKNTSNQTKISNEQTPENNEEDDILQKEHIKIVKETLNYLESQGLLNEPKRKLLQFVNAGGGVCSRCGKLEILKKVKERDVGFCPICLEKLEKQKAELIKDVCVICNRRTFVKKIEGEINKGICNNCFGKLGSNITTGLSRHDSGVSLDQLGDQDLSAITREVSKKMGLNGEASALLGELLPKNIFDKSDSSGKGTGATTNGSSQTASNKSEQMVFNEKGELVPLSSLKGTAAQFGYVKDANGKWVPAKSLEEATAAVKAANGSSQTASNKSEQMVFNEKGELVPLSSLKGTAAKFGYVKDANGKWVPAKSLEEATAAVKAANGTSQTASKKPEQMVFNEKGEVVPLSSLGGKKGYIKDANGNWVEAKSVDEAVAAVKEAINKGEVLTDKNGKLVQASTLKDEAPYGYKKDEKGNWVKANSLQEGIAATTGALATLAANVVSNIISTASSLASSLNALKRSSNLAFQQSLSTSLASTQNALNRSTNETGLQPSKKAQDKLIKAKEKLEELKGELREAEAAVSKADNEKGKKAAQRQVEKTKDQISKQEQTVKELEEKL